MNGISQVRKRASESEFSRRVRNIAALTCSSGESFPLGIASNCSRSSFEVCGAAKLRSSVDVSEIARALNLAPTVLEIAGLFRIPGGISVVEDL